MSSSAGIFKKPIKKIDRISNLHETVLSHILSRLPTKDVIRTSVLSRDWKHKWTFTYNVDITDSSSNRQQDATTFVKYVDRILLMSQSLQNFRLTGGKLYNLCDAQRWVCTIVEHNLERLEVDCDVKGIVFPETLLNSSSMRRLHLHNGSINIATKICAPHLHNLRLYNVEIVNEYYDTSTVTLTFPVLETFTATRCKWLNLESVDINAPVLTTFASWVTNGHDENEVSLNIIAPRRRIFVFANISCHHDKYNIQPINDNGLRIRKLLDEFTNLERLFLSSLEPQEVRHTLHRHGMLRRLNLTGRSNASELLELLHASPSLTFMKINVFDWLDYDYEAVESIPSCIIYSLEEVVLHGFKCEIEQNELVEFLLKNGKQLQRLSIFSNSRYIFDRVIEHIKTCPRASSCVTIDVDGEKYVAIDLNNHE